MMDMMQLEWKIPPNEADAQHGRYAVVEVFGRYVCTYRNGHDGDWRSFSPERETIEAARLDGDAHNEKTNANDGLRYRPETPEEYSSRRWRENQR